MMSRTILTSVAVALAAASTAPGAEPVRLSLIWGKTPATITINQDGTCRYQDSYKFDRDETVPCTRTGDRLSIPGIPYPGQRGNAREATMDVTAILGPDNCLVSVSYVWRGMFNETVSRDGSSTDASVCR
jgi:hypothetical protein